MKNTLFSFMLAFLLLGPTLCDAQDNKFHTVATVGISTPFLDNGVGFHFGINPSYPVSKIVSFEGQVSYMFIRINSTFLSGRSGYEHSINTLVGGRLYFISPKQKTRPYINLLLGLNYWNQLNADYERVGRARLGYSAGAYVEIHRGLIGLSLDAPALPVLKVGYNF